MLQGKCDMPAPIFSKLTHLAIAGHQLLVNWTGYQHLPCLTHLALDHTNITPGRRAADAQDLLPMCDSLVMFAVMGSYDACYDFVTRIEDPRTILITTRYSSSRVRDWEAGSWGESDMWTTAEKLFESLMGSGAIPVEEQ
jgi:hypothetical protein